MTSKHRQAILRARRKEQGLERVEVWVPGRAKECVKIIARNFVNAEPIHVDLQYDSIIWRYSFPKEDLKDD